MSFNCDFVIMCYTVMLFCCCLCSTFCEFKVEWTKLKGNYDCRCVTMLRICHCTNEPLAMLLLHGCVFGLLEWYNVSVKQYNLLTIPIRFWSYVVEEAVLLSIWNEEFKHFINSMISAGIVFFFFYSKHCHYLQAIVQKHQLKVVYYRVMQSYFFFF